MHGDVVSVEAFAPLEEAVDVMTEEEVGSLLVTESGQLVGILTEHDVVGAVWEHAEMGSTTVADVMTATPYCADPEDPIDVAVERMVQYGISHMPVVSGGRPVGVISNRDVLRVLSEEGRWARSGRP